MLLILKIVSIFYFQILLIYLKMCLLFWLQIIVNSLYANCSLFVSEKFKDLGFDVMVLKMEVWSEAFIISSLFRVHLIMNWFHSSSNQSWKSHSYNPVRNVLYKINPL